MALPKPIYSFCLSIWPKRTFLLTLTHSPIRSGGHMSSSLLRGDFCSSAEKLNFYWQGCWCWTTKKKKPRGQQSPTQFLSLIWCSFVSSLILHQKIYPTSQLMPEEIFFFFNSNTSKWSECTAVKRNWSHRGSQSDTTQTSKVFFGVDLFCYYHLHSTQKNEKWWEGSCD